MPETYCGQTTPPYMITQSEQAFCQTSVALIFFLSVLIMQGPKAANSKGNKKPGTKGKSNRTQVQKSKSLGKRPARGTDDKTTSMDESKPQAFHHRKKAKPSSKTIEEVNNDCGQDIKEVDEDEFDSGQSTKSSDEVDEVEVQLSNYTK
jgi:hypothetical protein